MSGANASFRPLGTGLRWASLVLAVCGAFGFVGAIVGGVLIVLAAGSTTAAAGTSPDDALLALAIGGYVVVLLATWTQMILAPFWLYKAWSWLPPEERYTKHWKSWITPTQAAWFLVIPYFQYYWMFVINTGLCDALDRLRARYPANDVAPKAIAIAAGVCTLLIPFPVGMLLWILFMAKVEAMTSDMARG